jgi:hypothetical protein
MVATRKISTLTRLVVRECASGSGVASGCSVIEREDDGIVTLAYAPRLDISREPVREIWVWGVRVNFKAQTVNPVSMEVIFDSQTGLVIDSIVVPECERTCPVLGLCSTGAQHRVHPEYEFVVNVALLEKEELRAVALVHGNETDFDNRYAVCGANVRLICGDETAEQLKARVDKVVVRAAGTLRRHHDIAQALLEADAPREIAIRANSTDAFGGTGDRLGSRYVTKQVLEKLVQSNMQLLIDLVSQMNNRMVLGWLYEHLLKLRLECSGPFALRVRRYTWTPEGGSVWADGEAEELRLDGFTFTRRERNEKRELEQRCVYWYGEQQGTYDALVVAGTGLFALQSTIRASCDHKVNMSDLEWLWKEAGRLGVPLSVLFVVPPELGEKAFTPIVKGAQKGSIVWCQAAWNMQDASGVMVPMDDPKLIKDLTEYLTEPTNRQWTPLQTMFHFVPDAGGRFPFVVRDNEVLCAPEWDVKEGEREGEVILRARVRVGGFLDGAIRELRVTDESRGWLTELNWSVSEVAQVTTDGGLLLHASAVREDAQKEGIRQALQSDKLLAVEWNDV